MKSLLKTVLLASAILCLFASCSKEPNSKSPEKTIVGKWSLDSIYDYYNNKMLIEYNGTNFYEFRKDGNGRHTYMGDPNNMSITDISWEVFEDYLIIKYFGETSNHTNQYIIKHLDRNSMILRIEIGERLREEYSFTKR